MKKSTLIILFVLAILKIHGQDYLICFAGEGDTTVVKSIEVYNLASGAMVTLNGNDTLHLIKSKGGVTRDSANFIDMPYTKGDQLLYKGMSGKYSTIIPAVPVSSDTVTFNFAMCTDNDNNNYTIVKIGLQTWMAENLKTTRYRDSTGIPLVTDNATWGNLTSPGYCWYENDSVNNKNSYGALYNWYTVNTGKLAPEGWHVPTDAEWTLLTNFLGGASIAGGKMKSTGTLQSDSGLWNEPNTGATNNSGFTANPGGYRYFSGSFNFINENAYFWSSSKSIGQNAWSPILYYNFKNVLRGKSLYSYGFSVRCVKGFPLGIENTEDMVGLKIYPNPASDNIYIDFTESQDLKFSIYTLVGELVLQKALGAKTNEIDIRFLPKGMYIMQISSANWKVFRKLLKE
jgi:uncharacterized protein (TIGR02145 family)